VSDELPRRPELANRFGAPVVPRQAAPPSGRITGPADFFERSFTDGHTVEVKAKTDAGLVSAELAAARPITRISS